jgi:hypothetical protein
MLLIPGNWRQREPHGEKHTRRKQRRFHVNGTDQIAKKPAQRTLRGSKQTPDMMTQEKRNVDRTKKAQADKVLRRNSGDNCSSSRTACASTAMNDGRSR